MNVQCEDKRYTCSMNLYHNTFQTRAIMYSFGRVAQTRLSFIQEHAEMNLKKVPTQNITCPRDAACPTRLLQQFFCFVNICETQFKENLEYFFLG